MKRHEDSAERDRVPIIELMKPRLPASGTLLELVSGSGENAALLASRLPEWTIQPSDKTPEALADIQKWRDDASLDNLRPGLALDVLAEDWPIEQVDAMFSANLLHVAPWSTAEGLFRGAAKNLKSDGRLFVYGPYLFDARPRSDEQAELDASLRGQDPKRGLRELADVKAVAQREGLALEAQLDTPGDNLLLVFSRAS